MNHSAMRTEENAERELEGQTIFELILDRLQSLRKAFMLRIPTEPIPYAHDSGQIIKP